MRRRAALLLLVSVSLPGCGLTTRVWRGGVALDVPGHVEEVVVSPKGDVSLRYIAASRELEGGIGFFQPSLPPGANFCRVILVPRSDMERLLAREGRRATPEVSGEELREVPPS